MLNKPAGITSRQAVDCVLQLAPGIKAGHAGTLDPLATGVLVVCLGRATRLIQYVQQLPKQYEATFLLGRRSDTLDTEGHVELLPDAPWPTRRQIEQLLPRFTGRVLQTPPAFSAVKVRGRRAYELARAGKQPRLKPRPVEIHELHLLDYQYPELKLRIGCGAGTYVRTLGSDLAQALGTAAVMSRLCRTRVGSFRLEEAVVPDELDAETLPRVVLPPLRAVEHLESCELSPEQLRALARGRPPRLPRREPGVRIAAVDSRGALAAVLESTPRGWRIAQNFAAKG